MGGVTMISKRVWGRHCALGLAESLAACLAIHDKYVLYMHGLCEGSGSASGAESAFSLYVCVYGRQTSVQMRVPAHTAHVPRYICTAHAWVGVCRAVYLHRALAWTCSMTAARG